MSVLRGTGEVRLDRAQWWPVIAVMLAGVVLIVRLDHDWSFFFDEWGTIAYRRSGGVSAFLAPHNGQLQPVVIAVYRALFATVGLRHYWPYELVNVALQAGLALLVFEFARRRTHPLVAVAVMMVVLLDGDAWQVLLWAINIGFVVPLLSLVGCLLCWRRPSGARVDAAMALLVMIALASSGLGLAVLVGVAILVVGSADRVRRGWIVIAPGALYVLWFFAYRPHALPAAALRHIPGASPNGDAGIFGTTSAISKFPHYVGQLAAASADSLVGASTNAGYAAALVLLAVVVVVTLWRRRVTLEMVAIVGALLTFWTSVAVTRLDLVVPTAAAGSRYVYPGAVMLALLLVEVIAGMSWRMPAAVVVAALALVAVHRDDSNLHDVARGSAVSFRLQNALFRTVECHPTRFGPTQQIDPGGAPGLTAPVYLAAVHALGSPPGQSCLGRVPDLLGPLISSGRLDIVQW